jgi:hypothetical protein
MRRLIVLLIALTPLVVPLAGCKRKPPAKVEVIEEQAPQLATVVHVADPQATVQLVRGFYELEQNAWRWTAGKFAVALRPPRGGAERGAVLQLKFSLADAVIERVKSMTLKARAGKLDLAPGTYAKPGQYLYSRDVPAAALAGDVVLFEFEVDKFLPPGEADQRELALIVSTIGLELK